MSNMNDYRKKIDELKEHLGGIERSSNKGDEIESLTEQISALERAVSGKESKDGTTIDLDSVDLIALKKAILKKLDEYKSLSSQLVQFQEDVLKVADEEGISITRLGQMSAEERNKRNELESIYSLEKYEELETKINSTKDEISTLARQFSRLQSSIEKAKKLEIDVTDYKEITDILKKKSVVDYILGQDESVREISKKAYKDRTSAERRAIKEAKERITKEIYQEVQTGKSIRESIEVLYSLDVEMFKVKKSKRLKMDREALDNIIKFSRAANVKFVGHQEKKNPLKGPEDMLLVNEEEVINNAMNSVQAYSKRYHVLKSNKESETHATEYINDFLDDIRDIIPSANQHEISVLANRYAFAEHNFEEAVSHALSNPTEETAIAQAEAKKKFDTAQAEFQEYVKKCYEEIKEINRDDEYEDEIDFSKLSDDELKNEIEKLHDSITTSSLSGGDVPDELLEQLRLAEDEAKKRGLIKNDENDNKIDYSKLSDDELKNEIEKLHDSITTSSLSGGDVPDELLEQLRLAEDEAKKRGLIKNDENDNKIDYSKLSDDELKAEISRLNSKIQNEKSKGNDVPDELLEQLRLAKDEAKKRGLIKNDENDNKIDYSKLSDDELKAEISRLNSKIQNEKSKGNDVPDELLEQLRLAKDEAKKRGLIKNDENDNKIDYSKLSDDELQDLSNQIISQIQNATDSNDILDLLEKLNAIDEEIAKRKKKVYQTSAPTTTPKTTMNTTPVYSVQAIIAKLTKKLNIGKKDVKRFNSSNIRVRDTFKNELRAGNYLYNIVHVVPTAVKATVSFFRKLGAKIMLRPEAKNTVEELRRRINNLTEDELQFLFDNYRGNAIVQDMNLQINDLLSAKLKEFGLAKVDRLNNTILDDFRVLSQLNEDKNNSAISDDDYYTRASILIENIIKLRKEGNSLLSGGIHGQEEDFRAAASKMNYTGLRFAKIADFDSELQQRLGTVEQRLNEAIETGAEREIVDRFLELEALYSKNTEVKNSIFGKRSVGAKNYTPLLEELNYNPDPFIRDLLTTIGTATSIVTSLRAINGQKIISEHNNHVEEVNRMNRDTINSVHETGNMIASKREVFGRGMQSNAQGDALGTAGLGEIYSLDSSNWHLSSDAYRDLDSHFHAYGAENYANISSQINDITNRCGQGAITNAQALEELAAISTSAHSTFIDMANQYKEVLANYAASHPQFDLSAYQGSIDALVNNSDAIANMNQAMVDTANLGSGLVDITLQEIEPLTAMPGLYSSLVTAASCAILSACVSKGARKRKQEIAEGKSEIDQMLDDYGVKENLHENTHGHYM